MKSLKNNDESLPVQLTAARFLIVNGRFATLLACPLFCILKLLNVPGFRFQWSGVLSFWFVCFVVWMVGRIIVNRWIDRQIWQAVNNTDNEEKVEEVTNDSKVGIIIETIQK